MSCEEDCKVGQTYSYFEPVYTSYDELRSSVKLTPAIPLRSHGKIFFKDNYLFINSPNEGVHVIDNSDPSHPKNLAFIKIPGSFDLVVKGNLLYSDSYIDLVVIDISNINSAIEVDRLEGVFSGYNSYGFYAEPELGIVTDWQEETLGETAWVDCGEAVSHPWGSWYEDGIALQNSAAFSTAQAVSPTNPGMAGSMSRFALSNDHLFMIDGADLLSINLQNLGPDNINEKLFIDWGIETLFPYKNNLFVGAQNGMHILDISTPDQPTKISTYTHVNSCDPVVVDGDYAYVTLRSGNDCAGFTNQLEIINISNLENPQIEHVYQMTNPHGLGKDADALFICDGNDGLKIYNVSDVSKIDANLVAHYKGIESFDVIPFDHVAMMIGEDGLYQYDYSDLTNIKLLSHLPIQADH
ncbi:LVIVD repeat-containing protein [Fulvivirga aurantia]|uniref:LVIVD repeat-containing protein n=1 Tax=Fulvivirga aurantia TaxID=2529383 RepID=UPI001629AFC0|nr:hypothetical protein [Fulvivirga aurantia]